MERIIQTLVGAGVGLLASYLVQVAGLQTKHGNLLNVISTLTGASAALAAGATGSLYRRLTNPPIGSQELDRAIAKVSKDFLTSASSQDIEVALKLLKTEIHDEVKNP